MYTISKKSSLKTEITSSTKRIGVFGGSFNPLHLGHIGIARSAIKERLVDEVWFVLSPNNPHKSSLSLLPETLRWKLLQRGLAQEKQMVASDIELSLPRPSYTVVTLRELRRRFPQFTFSLIIGEDNWRKFDKWASPIEILTHHPIIIYPRSSDKISDENSCQFDIPLTISSDVIERADIRKLSATLFPFSSTEIRCALRAGTDTTNMLPPSISNDCRKYYQNGSLKL